LKLHLTDSMFQQNIILGSGSPRRKELLALLGFTFTVKTKPTDESYPNTLAPQEVPIYLAKKKAAALLPDLAHDETLITADTIVVLEGKILGKPSSLEEAKNMLQQLSGKKHEVISGVYIKSARNEQEITVSTDVYFKQLSQDEIEYYVTAYSPLDKAGAYGIQEWIGQIGVEKIHGSYYNVVGLPTEELWKILRRLS
jgi:septum formation protein